MVNSTNWTIWALSLAHYRFALLIWHSFVEVSLSTICLVFIFTPLGDFLLISSSLSMVLGCAEQYTVYVGSVSRHIFCFPPLLSRLMSDVCASSLLRAGDSWLPGDSVGSSLWGKALVRIEAKGYNCPSAIHSHLRDRRQFIWVGSQLYVNGVIIAQLAMLLWQYQLVYVGRWNNGPGCLL